jgi:hypothetical protein
MISRKSLTLLLPLLALITAGTCLAEQGVSTPSVEGSAVYIISPADGETVSSPVTIRFGLRGMGVAPAGTDIPTTGHHHLLVDTPAPALDKPLGSEVKHFGKGQTETTLSLEPGEHSLQLILGDKAHRPHNPPVVSEKITITVR